MITFIESGKKRRGEIASCKHCKKSFIRRAGSVNGKKKIYCSRACGRSENSNALEISCCLCGVIFKRSPSKLKSARHGLYFCGRVCKEKAQSIGGGFSKIQPSHYGKGNGKSSYRVVAFKNIKIECEDCGITFLPLLTVHHKDGNRSNNKVSNLSILCCNHHALRHLKNKNVDGVSVWVRDNKHLTSDKDVLMLIEFLKMGL